MIKTIFHYAVVSGLGFGLALVSAGTLACDENIRDSSGVQSDSAAVGKSAVSHLGISTAEFKPLDRTRAIDNADALAVATWQEQYSQGMKYVSGEAVHSDGATHLDERFNAADKDHDGGLDREEAKQMPMLSQYFDEVDTNKDGKVTRQEYFNAMPLLHGIKKIDTSGNAKPEPM